MSTDDSISEDVSSSGALSHCHVDANGDGGKESEASLVSSEGTSASGLAGPEAGLTCSSKTAGGPAESRPTDITKACNIPQKIRSLCLSTEEAFGPGRSLPFINPSSLETLRALVQEIQSSGETDPEIWKDCEGRWLHLFQLVEKQYQEQILAQQEQYQCQIQLIQDEIKALVQLQNRQGAQPHPEYTSTPAITTKGYPLPHNDPPTPTDLPNGNGRLSAPPPLICMSPSPQPPGPRTTRAGESTEERATTVLSSGYGTLSPWDTGMEQTRTLGGTEEPGQGGEETHLSPPLQDHTETTLIGHQQSLPNEMPPRAEAANPSLQANQQRTSTQPLTSWAQRQKRRPKKSKAGQTSPQASELQEQQQPSPRNSLRDGSLEHTDLQDQHRSSVPPSNLFPLRRSDSLVSEASGLTYWRLDESELYRPLPDSFDSGAYLLLQETSMSLTPQEEPRISLREIYQNKQRTDSKRTDWDGSLTSSPMSPQVLTLDPTVHVRQSDRTSGFTSPSYFSSPSFPTQPLPYPCVGTPVSPDSMVEGSANPGDTDCTSNASSLSATTPTPAKVHSSQASPSLGVPSTSQAKTQPYFLSNSQQHRASAPLASEEEGSHTHTSTLKPQSHTRETHTPSGVSPLRAGSPRMERAASLEDPVVLSLLRQNLREKHAKHVADLKAYYESEIRALRDTLNLRDLPQDLEKSNQALRERCDHLERALTEASSRIQELETKNCILEKKLVDWPERYAVAGAMVTALQQRLEESKRSGKEKDASAAHLRTRVHQLEEALQNACRESDEREDRREREYKMLQDLLGEYDSLRKDHEGVKDNLMSTENKLFDANEQISELRRVVSKLESQVKQLEHENQARARYAPHSHTQPSGAGLLHHPDLLHSPSKHPREPESTYRRSPCPQTDQLNSHRKSPCPKTDQSAGSSGSMNNSRRCQSPPEREQPQEQCGGQREPGRREGPLTPVMKALIELEETRATEGQAPCKNSSASDRRGSRRPTVGFMEWGHREPVEDRGRAVEDRGGTAPEREGIGPERGGTTPERGWTAPQRGWTAPQRGGTAPERGGTAPERGGTAPERGGTAPERGAALLRAQRSLSPEGHRSSSLPPRAQRTFPPVTPTKRETLIMPLSARSSPKRCPTENYSTAFDNTITQQHLHNRFDVPLDQRCQTFNSTSPRKRLHFTALDRQEGSQQSCIGFADFSGSVDPAESGPRLGWEEHRVGGCRPDLQNPGEDSGLSLQTRLHSLVDAERLFDELTQEKQQIEASLSRMPGAGGRVSLQARLDEVALEKRLERVNRDLGSIRMTLKRFHVLRSSANI